MKSFCRVLPKIMEGVFKNDLTGVEMSYIDGFCDCFEDLPETVHAVQQKTPYNVEVKEFSGGFWVHGYKEIYKRG